MRQGSSGGVTTERPPSEPEEHERERRRLERILPEVIKRLMEAGYEKISEGPENVREFVREMKLPKEALALILAATFVSCIGMAPLAEAPGSDPSSGAYRIRPSCPRAT